MTSAIPIDVSEELTDSTFSVEEFCLQFASSLDSASHPRHSYEKFQSSIIYAVYRNKYLF
jgi:hypothetical protein